MQLMKFRREKEMKGYQETTCGSEALSIQPAKELLNCVLLPDQWIIEGLLATESVPDVFGAR